MHLIWIILAIFGGTLLTVQAAVNGSLGKKTSTETSTLVSFFMGTLALGIVVLLLRQGNLAMLLYVPKWQWITAVWGVLFVFLVVLVVPKIGVVVTTVLIIVGQLLVSMLVDNFGWFGNEVIPFGGKRLLGLVLMVGSLYFIFRAKRKS